MEQNQSLIDQLIAKNITASQTTKSQEVVVTVYGVTNWRPTRTGLPVVMVRTDKGNYFPLANSISNLPAHFPKPVTAKAVFTPAKDANGVDRINMSRLEFEGLDTEKLNMIKAMPKGTALFALAN